jgi:anaerobic selenocysteine-containing dehydrogenase
VHQHRNRQNDEEKFVKLKFTIPKFKGEDDADAYLDWELKVEKIFRIHNYSEGKKVAMASLEFEDYANVWWEDIHMTRAKRNEPPIATWDAMKLEMYDCFVPLHYRQDLFKKLQTLKQGFKSVEDYYKEMEILLMRGEVDETEEQTIARFYNGLNKPIWKIVDF